MEWDLYIEPLLFAYTETPTRSLGGFSPFKIIYGRNVHGPVAVLKELSRNQDIPTEEKTAYEYVIDLQKRLEATCNTTTEELAKSQEIMKTYFDRSARDRKLMPGDRALLLLPIENSNLQRKWKGPFPVKGKAEQNTYYHDINGTERLFHINMLKKYNEMTENQVAAVALLFDDDDDDTQVIGIESLEPKKVETYRDVHIDPKLIEEQKQELSNLIAKYQDIFSSVPGCTKLIQHNIMLTDITPI